MAKRYLLVDAASSTISKQPKKSNFINWNQCILCQEDKYEALRCPANSKNQDDPGYKTLAEDLLKFDAHGFTFHPFDLSELNDGSGVESTLFLHQAKWHKSCRLRCNKNEFQRKLKRQASAGELSECPVNVGSHSYQRRQIGQIAEVVCFFCDQPAGREVLHEATTFDIDSHVRQCATDLQDTRLLAKLAGGDMIAIEAKYHRTCLVNLYNHARDEKTKRDSCNAQEDCLHEIVFAELIAHIEELHNEQGLAPVFKLADLASLYQSRLQQLGVTMDKKIHTTRLKTKLMTAMPGLSSYSDGKHVYLTLNKHVGGALKVVCNHDSDAMHLVRAAQIVRKEIFTRRFMFDGTFPHGCQQDSVPSSLLALMNMILEGPTIKEQASQICKETNAAMSVAQIVMFNCVKHPHCNSSGSLRHNREQETPLPMYVALKVHALTRSRNIVDMLFKLGICISYDRLLQLTAKMANGVCQRFEMEGVVCPSTMRSGIFTVGAVDNIDHNPSSTTARDSFHGTGISIMQHPTGLNPGTERPVHTIDISSTSGMTPLPSKYTSVQPASLPRKEFHAPAVDGHLQPQSLYALDQSKGDEVEWLKSVIVALEKKRAGPRRVDLLVFILCQSTNSNSKSSYIWLASIISR